MKKLIFIFLILYCHFLLAQNQVGINQASIANSAVLDMKSDSLGFLLPRLSSTNKTAVASPAQGLLIYEATSNKIWYYNGGAWIKIISNAAGLDGIGDNDSDTRIFLDFTNDNDQIHFFVNGSNYFKMNRQRFDFINNGNSVIIGNNAGINDDLVENENVYLGYRVGQNGVDAKRNVGVGNEALRSNIDETDNVAIGSFAATSAKTAESIIAIGSSALKSNVSSNQLVAIGHFALEQHTTSTNSVGIGMEVLRSDLTCKNITAIGTRALASITNRNANIAIGYQAGRLNDGSNSIFIGNNSGSNEVLANRLYIDNSFTKTPLLFGDFSSDLLTINGSIRITKNIDYVGNITDISDRRLKVEIREERNVIDRLIKLNGYRYHLKLEKSGKKEYGVIAQEVNDVFPLITRRINPNNDFIGVSYVQFIPIILEAEKEQFTQLKSLKMNEEIFNLELTKIENELELIRLKLKKKTKNNSTVSLK